MKTQVYFLLLIIFGTINTNLAQVGIGTATPNAQLEIKASNQVTPSNKDGILIPKIDAFPVVSPTASQHSMLVFLTKTVAGNLPGFYYWDNTIPAWVALSNASTSGTPHNTLDMAYDQGGLGAGRSILADSGMVLISGDGIRATGNINSGNYLGTTTGNQMFFYPRRGAFRAGTTGVGGTWKDANPGPGGGPGIGNIGSYSVAMGSGTTASGQFSLALVNGSSALAESAVAIGNGAQALLQDDMALGQGAIANGTSATAIGESTEALGQSSIAIGSSAHALKKTSTAIGNSSQAEAINSTAIGFGAQAIGDESLAIGMGVRTDSFREFAIGSINTNGGGNKTTWVGTDRLFSIGNGNPIVPITTPPTLPTPSNALVILKNGNTGIGSDNPTSKLQVVGLPIIPFNTDDTTTNSTAKAPPYNLTIGAFYHTGNGIVRVVL